MNARTTTNPCQRCGGRMIKDSGSGDSACFTCGNVLYAVEPLPPIEHRKSERRPSHAGVDLA